MSDIMTPQASSKNKVLHDYSPSLNFYRSDVIFRHVISKELKPGTLEEINDRLEELGERAATEMDALSLQADKHGPELVKRNFLGETVDEIRFHPAYESLTRLAVKSGMFSLKWDPQYRERFGPERHRVGFAPGFLFTLVENGLYCPLCMTDGAARLVDKYCADEDRERLMPHIWTENAEDLYTGAMFLTEKAGGSDVGANLVKAVHEKDDYYRLYGEKWFCSNVNAEVIFALARTDDSVQGTRGLSIFLVEPTLPDGSKNDLNIVRLKDKLGVRSMASAECVMQGTLARRVGAEGEGFRIMTDMINLSRLYNSMSAIGMTRRGLVEAYTFLKHRHTFGAEALDHALVRGKLAELAALYNANFYMTWRAIRALDNADNGNESETHLLRLLTPMLKRCTAANSVYSIRESMELMGGMGYIEDGVIPKFMRDSMVLPIWEGAGNIMLLDMLRATAKSDGFKHLCTEISTTLAGWSHPQAAECLNLLQNLINLAAALTDKDADTMQYSAKPLFEKLTLLMQVSVLISYNDEVSSAWIEPSVNTLLRMLFPEGLGIQSPPDRGTVEKMVGWDIYK
ncbi:acyl-CoA dehydrogenase family protein [Roseivirga sp. BDSF3-8]|uniref:acyl-CoA dehydrogenase family protein n=1 Tax=Roseivirga sp. BDSF3-8 TaxID=3241598 RepID=UPI003531FD7F